MKVIHSGLNSNEELKKNTWGGYNFHYKGIYRRVAGMWYAFKPSSV